MGPGTERSINRLAEEHMPQLIKELRKLNKNIEAMLAKKE